ncbi:29527_t:CDS:1, partial [Racocetra persica]
VASELDVDCSILFVELELLELSVLGSYADPIDSSDTGGS